MTKSKAYVCILGWVIKEDGKIINRNPGKDKLKGLEEEPYTRNIVPRPKYYNETNTCEFIEADGKRCTEKLGPNARKFNINRKLSFAEDIPIGIDKNYQIVRIM